MERETEIIYLNLKQEGPPQYVAIEASRTQDNFFQIESLPPNAIVEAFKVGDVVRCAWRYFGSRFDGILVVISLAEKQLPVFRIGEKVVVSEHAGWNSDFLGTVVSVPESADTLLGPVSLYWIEFAEPQRERDQEYEYRMAQIASVYLAHVA